VITLFLSALDQIEIEYADEKEKDHLLFASIF
jgi:hypothetical protein